MRDGSMKGYDLSEREKDYIDSHPQLFASTLGRDLGKLYPEDNGGLRGKACINKYLNSEEHRRRVLVAQKASCR